MIELDLNVLHAIDLPGMAPAVRQTGRTVRALCNAIQTLDFLPNVSFVCRDCRNIKHVMGLAYEIASLLGFRVMRSTSSQLRIDGKPMTFFSACDQIVTLGNVHLDHGLNAL